jgi:hypothetical protein
VGAGIGSVVPVVGTGIGAGIGAGIGFIGGVAANEWLRLFGGHKFAEGGLVLGTGTEDSVPALLTPGELVVPRHLVQRLAEGVAAGQQIQQISQVRQQNFQFSVSFGTVQVSGERDIDRLADDLAPKLARRFREQMA